MAIGGLAITASVLAGACAGADDQPAVSTRGMYVTMTRPPTVPTSFLPTPNGWFDPDCVHAVAEHETVLGDGRISRADGSIRREAKQCRSPHFDVQGNVMSDPASDLASGQGNAKGSFPSVNGWIEDVESTELGAMSYVHASWTVPSNPPSNTGQIIYFFPGLVDSGVTRILQPVLGWNQAEGPSGWSMASWNCCVTGETWHGPYVAASPGTTVQGDMTGTNCNASGVCSNWAIVSYNATGAGVALATTVSTAMTSLYGHALEAYSIDSCGELPGSTSSSASSFVFRNASGTTVGPPTWFDNVRSVSPQCGYGVSDTGSSATLSWNVSTCDDGACDLQCIRSHACEGSCQGTPAHCVCITAPPHGECP